MIPSSLAIKPHPALRSSPRPSPGPGLSPGRGDPGHLFFNQKELQPSFDPLPGVDWAAGGGAYSPPHHHHHQFKANRQQLCPRDTRTIMTNLSICHLHPHQPTPMMMPGLTEEEFQRYKELLDIKCQYEKHKQQSEPAKVSLDAHEAREDDEEEGKGLEREEEVALLTSSAEDVNCDTTVSEHEMALIEEELRHLEFKWRNILRVQKMQQLRERCLKAWMMEETAAAEAGKLQKCNGVDSVAV